MRNTYAYLPALLSYYRLHLTVERKQERETIRFTDF